MRFRYVMILLLVSPMVAAGCAAIDQLAALRQVQFTLENVDQTRLAGVRLDGVQSYENLGPVALGRIGTAAARGQLPLSFVVHVGAQNPDGNPVAARLVQLDWTLVLDDTDTISGVFNDDRLIQPGQQAMLPIAMELDLMQFFDRSAPALINLALAVAGEGRQEIALRARPSISTPLGPIRYPGEIVIRHTVGS